MSYAETKVYFDGSHYIAIPHTEKPARPKHYHVEDVIEVKDDTEQESSNASPLENLPSDEQTLSVDKECEITDNESIKQEEKPKMVRKMTKKELFNELYQKCLSKKRRERRQYILKAMLPYFKSQEEAEAYIDVNLDRKLRNLICRRIRMCRKANLQDFNYFCTFTYDDKKHTEESFKKMLKTTLATFHTRKGWKYIGVWERSPIKQRLHFHGIFYIPEGTMPAWLYKDDTYSFSQHKRQVTVQNMYFTERFGRNSFEKIEHRRKLGDAMAYILKYIEKSGERIVYSKGLPQFFISDIMDEDVICTIGMEDKKLVLFDDFTCWDEGCYMGKVSPEVIGQMRKSN